VTRGRGGWTARSSVVVAVLLVGAAASGACRPEPPFQIVGDSVRPKDGDPIPRVSPFFDGVVVRLRAARGETLGVSVLVGPAGGAVRLELPAAAVRAFASRALDVREPSTAMYGPSRGAGRYADVLVPAETTRVLTRHAFFDVTVPPGAAPGRHAGWLDVAGRRLPVELRVDPVTIDLAAEPLVWVFYDPKEIARVHGTVDDDGPAQLAAERRYDELFRAHGAYLANDLPADRFLKRRPDMRGARYWPVALESGNDGDAALAVNVKKWLEAFRDLPTIPFAIPIDEPGSDDRRRQVRKLFDAAGRAGAGRPRFLRAVTDAVSPIYGDSVDVYIAPQNLPDPARARRASGERFWTYNGRPPAAGSMILDTDGVALRTWGWIAQRYDVELWYAWEGLYFSDRYNGGGPTDVMRQAITFDERRRRGPGKSRDFGNGDGVLAYPGPQPSLRLKALRRGLQDRLLARRLASCGGADEAQRIVHEMVPRALGEGRGRASWPTAEPPWEAARQRLLDALIARCPDAHP